MRSMIAALAVVMAASAFPCQRGTPVDPAQMVAQAHLIVRARAIENYDSGPAGRVRFLVREIVKGRHAPAELMLPGVFTGRDDFNDRAVPYNFVRPDGRRGSCFASAYKKGAEYLLILKLREGEYTADWYALGPTNEQLRSSDDPWLVWVRGRLK